MSGASGKWVTIGVIGAPHGVKGAVFVNTALENPLDLCTYGPLTLKDGRVLEVASVKPTKATRVIAAFKGIATRDQAQALTHQELLVPRACLPILKGETFYHADLIGLDAMGPSGEKLGKVVAVHNFGAGDILEIKTGDDTVMVAFTKTFVPDVDLKQSALTVSDAAIVR
jgi:16S rRNA processing protein RimM